MSVGVSEARVAVAAGLDIFLRSLHHISCPGRPAGRGGAARRAPNVGSEVEAAVSTSSAGLRGVVMADAEHDRNQAEERLSDLFEPDILLPVQYFAALKRKRFSCGEHRLLVAIMQDAIECFQKYLGANAPRRLRIRPPSQPHRRSSPSSRQP